MLLVYTVICIVRVRLGLLAPVLAKLRGHGGTPPPSLATRPGSLDGLVAMVSDTSGCCRSEHEALGFSEKLNRQRCLLTAAGGISDAHWDELIAILVKESVSVSVSVQREEARAPPCPFTFVPPRTHPSAPGFHRSRRCPRRLPCRGLPHLARRGC